MISEICLLRISEVYLASNNLDSCLETLEKAKAHSLKNNHLWGITSIECAYSEYYEKILDYNNALLHALAAIEYAKVGLLPELENRAWSKVSILAEVIGNHTLAFTALKEVNKTSNNINKCMNFNALIIDNVFNETDTEIIPLSDLDSIKFCETSNLEIYDTLAKKLAEFTKMTQTSIWWLDKKSNTISCKSRYQSNTAESRPAEKLITEIKYPELLSSLAENKTIVAHRAKFHPLTNKIYTDYLEKENILSIIYYPIIHYNVLHGIICLEKNRQNHYWSNNEVSKAKFFAQKMAGLFQEKIEHSSNNFSQHAPLSPAELKAAELASVGLSYKEIAKELGLSVATVRNQLQSVYRKMNVKNKTSLAKALSMHIRN